MPKLFQIILLITSLTFSLPGFAEESPSIDSELKALLKQAANEAKSFDDKFDAQVWLTDMSQRLKKKVPDPAFRVELLKQVHHEAKRAQLKPELVLAVIDVESNFQQYAVSRAGAHGLMQVMPFWLKEIGKPDDSLFRVQTNLRYGCTILKYYLQKEKGDMTRALSRYNGSTGKWWYPKRVYSALNKRWYSQ